MNAYDLAHQLARAVADSDEYRAFLEAKKKLDANPSATQMLLDFRRRQLELQAAQMMGQEPAKEKVEQLQRLEEIINLHADIGEFLTAEYRFSQFFADLQRVQIEAVEAWYKFADEITEGLTREAAEEDKDA
ncbi:MAG: YlbF family regulator [Bacillota bacterium]